MHLEDGKARASGVHLALALLAFLNYDFPILLIRFRSVCLCLCMFKRCVLVCGQKFVRVVDTDEFLSSKVCAGCHQEMKKKVGRDYYCERRYVCFKVDTVDIVVVAVVVVIQVVGVVIAVVHGCLTSCVQGLSRPSRAWYPRLKRSEEHPDNLS